MQHRIFKFMTRLRNGERRDHQSSGAIDAASRTLPTLAWKASLHCEVLKRGYSPDYLRYLPQLRRAHPRYGIGASNFQLGIASQRKLAALRVGEPKSPDICGTGPIGILRRTSKCALRHLRDLCRFRVPYREDAVIASGRIPEYKSRFSTSSRSGYVDGLPTST
jgi:hypothetical protein